MRKAENLDWQSSLALKTEFIFVRHAESTANAWPHDSPAQFQDPTLTRRGLQQAASFCEWIAPRDVKGLYVSDTNRARATAKPIETAYEIQARKRSEIDEWNLGKDGQVDTKKFQAMLERWCDGDYDAKLEGAPNSETLSDLIARVVPTYKDIMEKHRDDGGAIVIVGHGGAISWVMAALAQNIDLPFAVQNYLGNCCSISVMEIGGAPHVVRWADKLFH